MSNQDFTQQLSTGAARKAAAVTPNDNADLPNFAVRGLYVVAVGTLTVDPVDGAANVSLGTLPANAVGTVIPIQVRRVRLTGTTATVLALY
jgi:hypothetical protein